MFVALLHDGGIECSYSGYARQEMTENKVIDFPPLPEGIAPITSFGFSDAMDGPIYGVDDLVVPFNYGGTEESPVWLKLDISQTNAANP